MIVAVEYIYGIVIGIISIISVHIPFILLSFFNIRKFTITEYNMYQAIINKISGGIYSATKFDEISRPDGFFIGFWYAGFVDGNTITIICHSNFIKNVSEESLKMDSMCDDSSTNDVKNNTDASDMITIWLKEGSRYADMYYKRFKIKPRVTTPTEDQSAITNDIVSTYHANGTTVVFISGPMGCGKTTIGTLVTAELKGSLCYTFNPTLPGDNLVNLLCRRKASKDSSVLILLIDEIDVIFGKFDKMAINERYYTEVYDKMTYNTFLDNIYNYSNIVLILTSNMSKKCIDATYDPSFLRPGRVTKYYELTAPIEVS